MTARLFPDPARANAELQDTLQRSEPRIVASYALVGAVLLFGGLGYGFDWYSRTLPWGTIAGLLVGLSVGFANLALSLRR